MNNKNTKINMNHIVKNKNQKGFTLIELMVSISIFMMIMLVAMSSLFVSLNTSKRARALRYAMDNVNFAMDSMSRSIRMGTNYACGISKGSIRNEFGTQDCIAGNNSIAFIPQEGTGAGALYYGLKTINDKGVIERCDDSGSCADMTSSDVDIEQLKFVVENTASNNLQDKVFIYLKGTVLTDKGEDVSFSIQTLASQRNFLNN